MVLNGAMTPEIPGSIPFSSTILSIIQGRREAAPAH